MSNLLIAFPEHQEKIKVIFGNATDGNPVIASDIYRIIGMIYGQYPQLQTMEQSQFTYCDVDIFCDGLRDRDFSTLLESLFAKPALVKGAYLGSKPENNDIIKIYINDLNRHRDLCIRILESIKHEQEIFTYFPSIHKRIRSYEQDPLQNFLIPQIIKQDKLIKLVVHSTGMGLLEGDGISQNLTSGPRSTAGTWHKRQYDEEELLIHSQNKFFVYKEYSEELYKEISEDIEKYLNVIYLGFYAQRYGAEHPFNKAIRTYLSDNFLYNTLAAQKYVKHWKKHRKDMSSEQLGEHFIFGYFYHAIKLLLDKLDVKAEVLIP